MQTHSGLTYGFGLPDRLQYLLKGHLRAVTDNTTRFRSFQKCGIDQRSRIDDLIRLL